MNSEQFMNLLDKLGACHEAKEWARGKDFAEVYNTCHRGDWLAWLYQKTNPKNKRKLVLLGGLFANEVRYLMTDERSINAVDVCLRYGRGDATDNELSAASDAAWAAWAAASDAAWAAASDAASDASLSKSADIFRENVKIEDFNLNTK